MEKKLRLKDKVQIYIKNRKKRKLKDILFILFICIVGIGICQALRNMNKSKSIDYVSNKEGFILKATFVGDIMLGRNVEKFGEENKYTELFSKVSKIYKDSDYISGNFENAVLTKEKSNYTTADKYIHLNSTEKSVEALSQQHFDVVTLANNHVYDYGENGLRDTINILEKYNIDYIGAGENIDQASKYNVKSVNGVEIANIGISDTIAPEFTAYKEKPGIVTTKDDAHLKIIKYANKECDLVVVNIHWGDEYSFKESEYQRKLAQDMIDMGADIIIGHHPHVLHPIETYKDGIIFYSLGNFVFDQGWSRTKDSIIVNYKLDKYGNGEFEVIPLRIDEAMPIPTEKKFYVNRIFNQLTKNLDENSNWKIEENKLIIKATKI
ncbi:CapA family protein [Paraclostridium sordellii]|uniref:CapA family protein n=1 Tax=Paraclostridium sordellii TaxID=1505 RepID=UPI0005DD3754|nr:CapA family protein [Paeniclostridium sordellii]CEQ16695.1 poly-gamma-glutamate biosynthesis protein [[Clostridium] sordellii] [Paeniclostridium sordellii]CEQ26347.1 poly-gamma-glutamate biosynthesis protein [[Clostridium] sordellii] [Paeniclostridium sordellii]